MMSIVMRTFGRLDIAFNNAGVGGVNKPIHELEWTDYRRVLSINLDGVFLCMKHELAVLVKQQCGTIVNNASVAGLRGSPTMGSYVASKHAVIGLTRVAALEYAGYGIRVNAVCPGWTDTPILKGVADDDTVQKHIIAQMPSKRLGRPDEIADAVLWLCSDGASFVNGNSLVIDGGMTA